jgi:hypothetical protein
MTKMIEKPIIPVDGRKKNGGARPGAGRKPFEPTEVERKQVEAFSGYGLSLEYIAALIRNGIHIETLTSHFEKELLTGRAKAGAQMTKSVFQKAMSGSENLMKYWCSTQLGWKEPPKQLEHTGKDGGAITMAGVDLKGLNDTELAQMQALLQKANGGEE